MRHKIKKNHKSVIQFFIFKYIFGSISLFLFDLISFLFSVQLDSHFY